MISQGRPSQGWGEVPATPQGVTPHVYWDHSSKVYRIGAMLPDRWISWCWSPYARAYYCHQSSNQSNLVIGRYCIGLWTHTVSVLYATRTNWKTCLSSTGMSAQPHTIHCNIWQPWQGGVPEIPDMPETTQSFDTTLVARGTPLGQNQCLLPSQVQTTLSSFNPSPFHHNPTLQISLAELAALLSQEEDKVRDNCKGWCIYLIHLALCG